MPETTSMVERPSATILEEHRGEFTVSSDLSRMDMNVVHGYLSRAYWCEGLPRETLERAMRNSLCFGLFEGEQQVGFARVVSDRTTFAYVCDVFVLQSHQGRGLGTWLMQCVVRHPELQGLRRWHLTTRDAHSLYRKLGFTLLSKPERHMEIFTPDMYKVPKS
jgi:GNAT superfamily N-acetyltransferase